MKKIQFEHVSIRNFFSIGSEAIEIDFTRGLHIITGVNKDKEDSKNGVGKSAIADSIFFALFGQTLRNIKVENISNWKTKDGCEVDLKFSVTENYVTNQYRIVRTLNPSRVSLSENGKNISRTISKTNIKIKKVLSTTPELFEQCVIMSLNQTEPFLAKTPTTKRKFIEGIFHLNVFSEMLAIIRHDINETNRKYNSEQTRNEEIKNSLMVQKRQQTEHAKQRNRKIKELEERRHENIKEIRSLSEKLHKVDYNQELENIDAQIKAVKQTSTTAVAEIAQLVATNTTNQSFIVQHKQRFQELEDLGHEICLTCKRPFSEADKEQHQSAKDNCEEQIKQLNGTIKELDKKIQNQENIRKQCEKEIDRLINNKHHIEMERKENESLKQRIIQLGEWNKQIQKDIEDLSKPNAPYEQTIKDIQKRLDINLKILNEIEVTQQKLDIAKFVVSEEGVKSFIVKKMLQMLNSRLNFYLKKLDANCVCTFNEYFEENIVNEKGLPVSYFNFSGGERKRIDLAMLFTFLDIRRLQTNVSINIALYDELLDTSIDGKGIQLVLDILQDRISDFDEAVYIISHRNEAIKYASGDIIFLEKENEITRRTLYEPTI